MSINESLKILILSSMLLYFFQVFIKFLWKGWWTPMRIQYELRSAGIRGPSYKFIHGNIKEISKMRETSNGTRMSDDISHQFFPDVLPHIFLWTKIYGRNFIFWHGPRAKLVIAEPELIKEMMNNRDMTYARPEQEKFMKKILGDGIFIVEGEKWRKVRKLSDHAFHGESLKNMTPAMVESVKTMLKGWRNYEGREIEVYEEFRKVTSEVISRTAFGSSYLEGQRIFEMLRKFATIVGKNTYNIRLPGLSQIVKNRDDIESEKLEKGIRDSIIEIITRREKQMAGVYGFGRDFLGLLLKAHHDADLENKISREDIIEECKTFYVAAHGSTADFLSWTVLLLSIHTDWQDRAREEVLELLGQQHPTAEGISKLKLMSMIMNESLRLYPPVVYTERRVERKTKLGNFILPADIDVQIPILALQHDPEIWGGDAHLFRPERFQDGIAAATKNNPAAFSPFGRGPRGCVGMNFALNQAKITLSMIMQRYAFTVSPKYNHSPLHIMSLVPQNGVQVTLRAL